jgi:hypothetical protein
MPANSNPAKAESKSTVADGSGVAVTTGMEASFSVKIEPDIGLMASRAILTLPGYGRDGSNGCSVTIAKSMTAVLAPAPRRSQERDSVHQRRHIRFEIVENCGQLKRYDGIGVVCDRTCEVHHSKSRAYNGGLILAYGVRDGQAVSPGWVREGSREPSKR